MSRLIGYRTLVLVIFCGLVAPHKADIVFPDQISPRQPKPPVEPRTAENTALLSVKSITYFIEEIRKRYMYFVFHEWNAKRPFTSRVATLPRFHFDK